MKLLLACDMEGVSGVTSWDHVDPTHAEYQRFRKIMTGDVNAAIEGAFKGGAKEIVVTDGHSNGLNILVEDIDHRVRVNSGLGTSPYSMMQGIDESFNGVIFIGYHARAGSPYGILDHTWSSRCIANVWLNDVLLGEYGLNAALAGSFGVPVIMVSGDQTACQQTEELLGHMEKAIVKQATGRFSASCLPPAAAQILIRNTALTAVEKLKNGKSPKPYQVKLPVKTTIEFVSSDMTDRAERIPGSARDGKRISFTSPDMKSAYISFRAAAGLASLS